MSLTVADIYEEIRLRLGFGAVEVELTDPQIDICLKQTVRRYNTHIGLLGIGTLSTAIGAPQVVTRPVPAGTTFTVALPVNGGAGSTTLKSVLATSLNPVNLTTDDLGNVILIDSVTQILIASTGYFNSITGGLTVTLTGAETFLDQQATFTYLVRPASGRYLITHPNLAGIIYVDGVENDLYSAEQLDTFNPYTYSGIGSQHGFEPNLIVDYATLTMYREMQQRILADDFNWRHEVEDGEHYLYVAAPATLTAIMYEFKWHLSPDDDATTGLRHLPDSDADWVIDMTLALSQQLLGRILRKHGGMMNSDGGVDSIDGSELVQEGREDEQRHMEELKKRKRTPPPMIG